MTDILFTQIRLNELEALIENSVRNALRDSKYSGNAEKQPETDRWFCLSELCAYLPGKPARPTVYGWVGRSLIPVHKTGKNLRFLKSEIDLWLLSGRKKTLSETAKEAELYCTKNRRK